MLAAVDDAMTDDGQLRDVAQDPGLVQRLDDAIDAVLMVGIVTRARPDCRIPDASSHSALISPSGSPIRDTEPEASATQSSLRKS
jgi:hypothetical protein